MWTAIIRGFTHLARFGGRDTRAQFWPYAGAAVALYLVLGLPVAAVLLTPLLWGPTTGSEAEAMTQFIAGCLVMFALLVALLAAAVARRLRDSGRSALWGLIPFPFVTYSGAMFPRLMTEVMSGAEPMGLFLSVFVSNMLYMAGVATLLIFLVLPSKAPTAAP